MHRCAMLLVACTGCAEYYNGPFEATVTTTIVLTAPAASEDTNETVEMTEFVETSLKENRVLFRRGWLGGSECILSLFTVGGYGLRFEPDQTCERDGATWTLDGGGRPNDDFGDVLAFDLAWTIESETVAGTVTETLRGPF